MKLNIRACFGVNRRINMSDRDRISERVARHYNDTGFEFESARLSQHFPIEFAITSRYLNRWISDNATVVDIGVVGRK